MKCHKSCGKCENDNNVVFPGLPKENYCDCGIDCTKNPSFALVTKLKNASAVNQMMKMRKMMMTVKSQKRLSLEKRQKHVLGL